MMTTDIERAREIVQKHKPHDLSAWKEALAVDIAAAISAARDELRSVDATATINILTDAMNYARQTLGALNEAKAALDAREHNEMQERDNG